jgi:hypothetical protein
MKTKELFLTTSDVARRLNRSSQCIIGYERSGRLPAIKTANGWRLFKMSDVTRLADELSAKPSNDESPPVAAG